MQACVKSADTDQGYSQVLLADLKAIVTLLSLTAIPTVTD